MFYRAAAVLLVLFSVGHTLGFRQSDPTWGVDPVLASMQSTHFTIQGFTRTYWDFFTGAGLTVGVLYLFAAVLAWPELGISLLGSDRHVSCRHGLLGRRRVVFWKPIGGISAGAEELQP